MNIIVGFLLAGASLLAAAAPQADQAGPESSREAATANTPGAIAQAGPTNQDADQKADATGEDASGRIQSTMEQGVLVVRHSGGSAGAAATGVNVAAAPGPDGAPRPASQPYRLFRVHVDQPWKYARPRERNQAELKRMWSYRPQATRKYQPPPRRSRAELERLWSYHPTLP
jgi:hypothetical protein